MNGSFWGQVPSLRMTEIGRKADMLNHHAE